MNKKVFIAGPYTSDPVANTRLAMVAGHMLIDCGHFPFIPHLFHFMQLICPREYEVWTRQDFAWLPQCDVLVRLPGESAGADAEVKAAEEMNMPVYYSIEEFLDAS